MMGTWRTVITIAGNQLQRVAVDWPTLVWLAALPLVIIFVLSVSLQGMFTEAVQPVSPVSVVVAVSPIGGGPSELSGADRPLADNWAQLGTTRDTLLAALAGDRALALTPAADAAAARQAVLERRAAAAVVVPAAYPTAPVQVIAVPGSLVAARIAGDAASARAQDTAAPGGATQASDDEARASDWFGADAFAYFSVMVVSFFVLSAGQRAMLFYANDRLGGVYARVRAGGVDRRTYLLGGLAGSFVISVTYLAFMSGAAWLLFGIGWGDFFAWAELTLAAAAAVATASFAAAAAARRPEQMEGAGSVFVMGMAFLGGSLVPLPFLPDWIQGAFAWAPNRALLEGYLALAGDGSTAAVTPQLRALLLGVPVFGAIGWLLAGASGKEETA